MSDNTPDEPNELDIEHTFNTAGSMPVVDYKARADSYADQINKLRNVIQSACIGGMPAMAERWAVLFPDAGPLPDTSQSGGEITGDGSGVALPPIVDNNERWADAVMPPDVERRLQPWLTNGAALHPLTINLVVRFARALAAKLAAAEVKYGYSAGWAEDNWLDECRRQLTDHIDKGDPLDVAAYCAFLWHHGADTFSRAWNPMSTAPRDGSIIRLLVEFENHPLEDHQAPQHTIGSNSFDNTGVDEWQFVGWCRTHDHFTEGTGKVIGWLPFDVTTSAPSGVPAASVPAGEGESALRNALQELRDCCVEVKAALDADIPDGDPVHPQSARLTWPLSTASMALRGAAQPIPAQDAKDARGTHDKTR